MIIEPIRAAGIALGAFTGHETGKQKNQRVAGIVGGVGGALVGERLMRYVLSKGSNPAVFAGAVGASFSPFAGALALSEIASRFSGHVIEEHRPALKTAAYDAGIKEALLANMAKNVARIRAGTKGAVGGAAAKKAPKVSKTLGMDQRASQTIRQSGVNLKQVNFQPPTSARPPRA